MNIRNYIKLIAVVAIALLVILPVISDAKHYSTTNPHQTVIHKSQHHYENSGGNPPPHRHSDVSEFEIRGIGKHWNKEHNDE